MKFRINLDNKEFLCKEISEIKIDDVLYLKKDYKTSVDIQHFYFFIRKNIDIIQYLKERKTNNEYLYKDKKLHSFIGPSLIYGETNRKFYYINGQSLTKKDWLENYQRKNYFRNLKLEKIINESI